MEKDDLLREFNRGKPDTVELSNQLFSAIAGIEIVPKYPRWKKGCCHCRFVGCMVHDSHDYDLYYCTDFRGPLAFTKGGHSLEYKALIKDSPVLMKALHLAIEQKVFDPDKLLYGGGTVRGRLAEHGVVLP